MEKLIALEFILFALLAGFIAASQPKPHHHKQGKIFIIIISLYLSVYCLCIANSNTLEHQPS